MSGMMFLCTVSLMGIQELACKQTHQIMQIVTLCIFVKLHQVVAEKLSHRILRSLWRNGPNGRRGGKVEGVWKDSEKTKSLPQVIGQKLIAGLKSSPNALLQRRINFLQHQM